MSRIRATRSAHDRGPNTLTRTEHRDPKPSTHTRPDSCSPATCTKRPAATSCSCPRPACSRLRCPGWLPVLADDRDDRQAAEGGQVVHPAVDGRRPQPQGHLRPQARQQGRRRLQADQDRRASGIEISEHLPKLARLMKHGAIVRGMTTPGRAHPPGQVLHAHRLPRRAGRASSIPCLGSIVVQGSRQARRLRCRTSSPSATAATAPASSGRSTSRCSSPTRPRRREPEGRSSPATQFDNRVGLLGEDGEGVPPRVPGRRRSPTTRRPTSGPSS